MDKDILSKITQGKWIIGVGCRIRDEYNNSIALCAGDGSDFDWKTNESNAQLIANAPQTLKQRNELLEACKKAHDSLLCLHVCSEDKAHADATRDRLKQAIAEAEDPK